MTLETATLLIRLDLDDDGVYETDITTLVPRKKGIFVSEMGRKKDLSAAGSAKLTMRLDNEGGPFSPGNTGSPYWDAGRAELKVQPLKRVQVQVIFDGVTYDWFTGRIDLFTVDPQSDSKLAVIFAKDFMEDLNATDIRLPLMLNALTGNIINRLIDYAELGELIANDRFKDDLTDYSDLGAATTTRVTTGVKLHEPAAANTVGVTGPSDGWRYAIPHLADADLQGKRARGAVYVWAVNPADVGRLLRVQFADNISSGAGQNILLTAEPQYVDVPAFTFGAAATDFFIQVVGNAIITAAAFRTGAVHVVLAGNAFDRAVDDGVTRLARYTRDSGSALRYIQEVRKEELGGLFFFDGLGQAVFHDREHRWRESKSTAVQQTFVERGRPDFAQQARDRVSEVVLEFPRFEIGDPGEVVFQLFGALPRVLPANGTLTIEAEYFGAIVTDVITPVSGSDFIFNERSDGLGADKSSSVTLDWEDFGGAGVAKFTNTLAVPLFLTSLRVRGTVVRPPSDTSPARVVPATPPALANVLRLGFRWNDSEASIQSWAEFLAIHFGDRQRSKMILMLGAPFPNADDISSDMVDILKREVSDRVAITSTQQDYSLKFSAEPFYIDSIKRRIEGDNIVATYRLSEVQPDFWIVGTSVLGTDTVLAP